MHQRCQQYGQRPSSWIGIEHPVLAHLFDEAVGTFGTYIENKSREQDDKGKLKHRIEVLLEMEPEARMLTMEEIPLLFG